MARVANYQVIGAVEPIPGTLAGGLYASGNAALAVFDPEMQYLPNLSTRAVSRASLTKANNIAGIKEATLTFEADIAGATGSATTVPAWSRYLEACGLIRRETHAAPIGAVSVATNFIHGEILNDDATPVGTVIHDTFNGQSLIRFALYDPTTPIASGSVLTGATSGATATTSAGSGFEGYSWHPFSEAIYALTLDTGLSSGEASAFAIGTPMFDETTLASGVVVANPHTGDGPAATDTVVYFTPGVSGSFGASGDVNTARDGSGTAITFTAITPITHPSMSIWLNEDGPMKKMIGARGSMSLSLETGNGGRFAFNFRGKSQPANDTVKLTGVTYTAQIPPAFISATLALFDATNTDYDTLGEMVQPCIDNFSLDLANTLSPLTCASSGQGIRYTQITDREPTASMDPLVDLEAAFPFLGRLRSGNPFGIRCGWGTDFQNAFYLTVPAAQIDSESKSDKDGTAVRDTSLKLVGGIQGGSEQVDNEFVLSYIAADPASLSSVTF